MKTRRRQSGFTILETIIAVMILAISLTTLLGLQSSSTDQAIRTRNKQQAMLAARQILSAIEMQGATVQDTTINAPVETVLDRFLVDSSKVLARDNTEKNSQTSSLPLTADLTIGFTQVEGLPSESIKRVDLIVYWSDNPQDKVQVVYLVPM